ncbi:MAG: ATP-binding protein [Pseudorhodoplanes sp.]|nr:ATP-binding protein [Pseudorhodoplanes sp.]
MATTPKTIRPKDRDTIIQALGAGVVPRLGLQHIQVGRAQEVAALLKDIERIGDSASTFRFIIGEYGAGKTFFLNLIRAIALEKKLVTVHADLGPYHRLHATGGQARSLYAETIKNLATRNKPDGGTLESVVEVFITKAKDEAEKAGKKPEVIIQSKLAALREHTGGFDFTSVIAAYLRGSESGNDELKSAAIR